MKKEVLKILKKTGLKVKKLKSLPKDYAIVYCITQNNMVLTDALTLKEYKMLKKEGL